jgi:DNA-binding XRE family transcriptional regulator/DNA polymerase III delta prime subunit
MEHERKPNRLLAHKRIERHLTQARLAETLEVSLDTVRNWERGRSSPSLVMRARLCEFFSATPEELDLGSGNHLEGEWEEGPVEDLHLERLNRQRIIQRIRNTWVNGVLEESLQHTALMELGLQDRPDALANPWYLSVQETAVSERPLPPGTTLVQMYDIADGELLVLGEPGAGKTTLLLELARVLLVRSEQNKLYPIPVVFHVSSWSLKDADLTEWLVQELESKYYLPQALAREWLQADRIALLLDGLDETANEERLACMNAVRNYQREHVRVPLVICCRREEYFSLQARFELQRAVLVQPLTSEQITTFLSRAGKRLAGVRHALDHDDELREMIKTPLMLSIVALAYEGKASTALQFTPSQAPEERRQIILQTYVERTLNRRSVAVYPPAQTIQRLSWLAGRMKTHGMTDFYLEHMQPDWLPDQRTIQRYRLAVIRVVLVMTTLLEAGLLACFRGDSFPNQPGLFFWVGGGKGNSVLEWMAPGLSNWLRGATGMLLINGQVSVLIVILGTLGYIPLMSKKAVFSSLLNSLRYGLPTALIFGVCAGFLYWHIDGEGAVLHGVVDGLFAGYAVGLVQGLGTLLRYEVMTSPKKQENLLIALRSRMFNGFILAVSAFVAFTGMYAWQSGTINALIISYGIVIGCLFGVLLNLNVGTHGQYDLGLTIRPVEKVAWSWRAVWQQSGETLKKGIQLGGVLLLIALIGTTGMSSFSYGPGYGIRYGLIYGLVVGLISSVVGIVMGILTSGWSSSLIDDRQQLAKPNEGILRSLRNALFAAGVFGPIGGTTSGLVSGLAFWASGIQKWYVLGLGFALIFTLRFAFQFFVAYGGTAVLEHFLLRWYLRKSLVPWRYAAFLDYASTRILLRKLGEGYIFIHRLLLEYFAQNDAQKEQESSMEKKI